MFDLLGERFVHGAHSIGQGRFAARPVVVDGSVVSSVMRVWIDQDLCTGDGLCVDHCPDVFAQLEDGIAYVAEGGYVLNDPGGGGSLAWVPPRNERRRHPRRRGLPRRVHLHRRPDRAAQPDTVAERRENWPIGRHNPWYSRSELLLWA